MDEITRKRPGRPRKAVADAQVAGKGGDLPEVVTGLGEAGSGGTEVPAEHGRQGEKLVWAALVRLVHEKHSRDHQIATVWHPDSDDRSGWLYLETKFGNVRVQQGPAQYQLTTGEIIKV